MSDITSINDIFCVKGPNLYEKYIVFCGFKTKQMILFIAVFYALEKKARCF